MIIGWTFQLTIIYHLKEYQLLCNLFAKYLVKSVGIQNHFIIFVYKIIQT